MTEQIEIFKSIQLIFHCKGCIMDQGLLEEWGSGSPPKLNLCINILCPTGPMATYRLAQLPSHLHHRCLHLEIDKEDIKWMKHLIENTRRRVYTKPCGVPHH